MIARLHVQLPFFILVVKNAQFVGYRYEIEGIEVRPHPPIKRTDLNRDGFQPREFKIDGEPARECDILRIDFHSPEFNRKSDGSRTPSNELIKTVVNDFICRLRYTTLGHWINELDFPNCFFQLEYLNDDYSKLDEIPGLIREDLRFKYSLNILNLTPKTWDDVHSLAVGEKLNSWRSLILDAKDLLPRVGPAIVLTYTALEILITKSLSIEAPKKVGEDIWRWIEEIDYRKAPSVSEKYDELSSIVFGFSLKSDSVLWEGMKNIRSARNSFAHEGIAIIGNDEVTLAKAIELIEKATQIVELFEGMLPDSRQSKKFSHKVEVTFSLPISQE